MEENSKETLMLAAIASEKAASALYLDSGRRRRARHALEHQQLPEGPAALGYRGQVDRALPQSAAGFKDFFRD
jgi:hypothetical protein